MTDFCIWHNELIRAIETAELLRQPRRLLLNDNLQGVVGRITVEGRSIEIALDLKPLWYHQLPRFFLRPPEALGFLPHVDEGGQICFLEHEGIVFDWRHPLTVIEACLIHVQRTLREGMIGDNKRDFADEFEVYWIRVGNPLFAIANLVLPRSDEVAEVFVGSSSHARGMLRITHDAARVPAILDTVPAAGPWTVRRALYLPLEPGTLLLPPQFGKPLWGQDGVRRLLEYCSVKNLHRLLQLLQKRSYTQQYLIVRLPRPDSEATMFGVFFEEHGDKHPLVNPATSGSIKPIVIFPRDKQSLLRRSGGCPTVVEKRVLLIGCGAVGGHIVFNLAQAGVEHIHLVDGDELKPENAYRHVLGKQYWGKKKVHALQQALHMQQPFSQAKAFTGLIEQVVATGEVNLSTYDVIVSAIGAPTSELALNEQVRRLSIGPPIVFTWVDPYGIGGHAALTGLDGLPGCFECLYVSSIDNEYLYNRASFAAPNQIFHRSMTGCQGFFTPYSSLDAVQTAQLAARQTVDVLTGKAKTNRLRSWKGDATDFITKGFKVSDRYALNVYELEQRETSFFHDACPVCADNVLGPTI